MLIVNDVYLHCLKCAVWFNYLASQTCSIVKLIYGPLYVHSILYACSTADEAWFFRPPSGLLSLKERRLFTSSDRLQSIKCVCYHPLITATTYVRNRPDQATAMDVKLTQIRQDEFPFFTSFSQPSSTKAYHCTESSFTLIPHEMVVAGLACMSTLCLCMHEKTLTHTLICVCECTLIHTHVRGKHGCTCAFMCACLYVLRYLRSELME